MATCNFKNCHYDNIVKKESPIVWVGYDFYPTSCVFSLPEPWCFFIYLNDVLLLYFCLKLPTEFLSRTTQSMLVNNALPLQFKIKSIYLYLHVLWLIPERKFLPLFQIFGSLHFGMEYSLKKDIRNVVTIL